MHLVIPVTIATAMAAAVMHQRCFSGTERPEETDFLILLDTAILLARNMSHSIEEVKVTEGVKVNFKITLTQT